jgi:hypothetical protein
MPLVTPAGSQVENMVREPGKEITTDADLSEREKESLYDLLERWVTMRPSGGATAISITTTFKA